MGVGRTLFYDTEDGDILVDTFEKPVGASYRSADYYIQRYSKLSERNRDTFNFIELPFGAFAQDFAECNGYWVNPETKQLEFSYPDPNEPEAPPVFVKPLTEQIAELKTEQFKTNQIVANNGLMQQELIELIMEMEMGML